MCSSAMLLPSNQVEFLVRASLLRESHCPRLLPLPPTLTLLHTHTHLCRLKLLSLNSAHALWIHPALFFPINLQSPPCRKTRLRHTLHLSTRLCVHCLHLYAHTYTHTQTCTQAYFVDKSGNTYCRAERGRGAEGRGCSFQVSKEMHWVLGYITHHRCKSITLSQSTHNDGWGACSCKFGIKTVITLYKECQTA